MLKLSRAQFNAAEEEIRHLKQELAQRDGRIEQLEEKLRKENNYAYVIDSQGIVHHSFTIVYRDTLGEKKDG